MFGCVARNSKNCYFQTLQKCNGINQAGKCNIRNFPWKPKYLKFLNKDLLLCLKCMLYSLCRKQSFGVYNIIENPGLVLLPPRCVPSTILHPPYDINTLPPTSKSTVPEIKTRSQIEGMRASCSLARQTLNFAKEIIKVK